MTDDAEFDAFLNGEGDLARRLQGLAQPGPSAALDAAILANARAAMAQQGPSVAANDSGDATPAPRLAPSLGWRWRIPAGIAATVLVGVFANQTFQSAGELNELVVPVAPSSEVALPAVEVESTPAPQPIMQDKTEPAPAPMAPAKEALQRPVPTKKPVRAEPAPVVEESAAQASAAAPVAAPAPAPAPAADPEREVLYYRVRPSTPPALKSAPAPAPRVSANSLKADAVAPGPWLDWIEKLLEQGNKTEAVEQWTAFRAAHPDYPVPAATREKLE